jgi:hypothetical protein
MTLTRKAQTRRGERNKYTQEEKKSYGRRISKGQRKKKQIRKNRKIERKVGRDSVVGIATR